MALPVLAGMAVRYVGAQLIEKGVEKLAESALSGGKQMTGEKLDVPMMPSHALLSSVAEPALKSALQTGLRFK